MGQQQRSALSDKSSSHRRSVGSLISSMSYRKDTASSRAKRAFAPPPLEDHGSSTQRNFSASPSPRKENETPKSGRKKAATQSARKPHHPSATETQVVRKLDNISRVYIRDVEKIHELRTAKVNFADSSLTDLSSSTRSSSHIDREIIALSKVTKDTRLILELLNKEKNRSLQNTYKNIL